MAAPLVGVLLAAGGCSSEGGDDSDVEDVAAASSVDPDTPVEIPVTTEDGRMLQPAGHVGIWFETEPSDPLDRLVWKSQQFVGQPLELDSLGDAARTPESADLPNVCAPEVFERLQVLGIKKGTAPDVGLGYTLCAASGVASESSIRSVGFMWGSDTSPDKFLGTDGVSSLDESGIDVVVQGGFSEIAGCIAFREFDDRNLTLFSWPDSLSSSADCSEALREYQIVHNSIGGYFV